MCVRHDAMHHCLCHVLSFVREVDVVHPSFRRTSSSVHDRLPLSSTTAYKSLIPLCKSAALQLRSAPSCWCACPSLGYPYWYRWAPSGCASTAVTAHISSITTFVRFIIVLLRIPSTPLLSHSMPLLALHLSERSVSFLMSE